VPSFCTNAVLQHRANTLNIHKSYGPNITGFGILLQYLQRHCKSLGLHSRPFAGNGMAMFKFTSTNSRIYASVAMKFHCIGPLNTFRYSF